MLQERGRPRVSRLSTRSSSPTPLVRPPRSARAVRASLATCEVSRAEHPMMTPTIAGCAAVRRRTARHTRAARAFPGRRRRDAPSLDAASERSPLGPRRRGPRALPCCAGGRTDRGARLRARGGMGARGRQESAGGVGEVHEPPTCPTLDHMESNDGYRTDARRSATCFTAKLERPEALRPARVAPFNFRSHSPGASGPALARKYGRFKAPCRRRGAGGSCIAMRDAACPPGLQLVTVPAQASAIAIAIGCRG